MANDKNRVKTLEENIMESADWSTSSQICTKCTQGDLENALNPIIQALMKMRRDTRVKEARSKLMTFIGANEVITERVFEEHVSKAAICLYRVASSASPGSEQCKEVYDYLKNNLEPIAVMLEAAASPKAKRLAKRLRKVYEKRSSAPPMAREEMLRWGLIPWKKMTPDERGRVLDAQSQRWHEELERRERCERYLRYGY